MISPECNLQDFINAVNDKSYEELILLADREATKAERNYYRKAPNADACQSYAQMLKNFIYFMRNHSQSSCCHTKLTDQELLRKIKERAQPPERCSLP